MSKKKTNGYCHDISCPPFLEADLGLLPESIVPFSRDGRAMLRSLREYTTRGASESHTHTRARRYKKQSKTINQKTEEEDGRSTYILVSHFFIIIEEEEEEEENLL